jgi:hypothetical protein
MIEKSRRRSVVEEVQLRPGESMDIRAPGTWFLIGGFRQTVPQSWSRDLAVRGSVNLFSMTEDQAVLKSDALQIQLRQP